MITLTLLHPVQGTAVQSWSFQHDQSVRIGRAVDNEVVLYSAVVSRHHVELRHEDDGWHVHNLGINGTFLEGKKIESEPLVSGQTIRLARSGPNIQVLIQSSSDEQMSEATQEVAEISTEEAVPHSYEGTQVEMSGALTSTDTKASPSESESSCDHSRSPNSSLICIDCGEPMKVLNIVGSYKILKSLNELKTTFQAWKNKRTYILRTAPAAVFVNPELGAQFHAQLQRAENLNHGGIPRMIEVLEHEGQFYLVYEMVYGRSVSEWVADRGILSLPSAIAWITEIARIVEYLHQLDPPFIHQGINPNTIIRPTIPQGRNSLMLVNFGQFAHMMPKESRQDSSSVYRSPHQDLSNVSVDLDLYALGATFLFMLTGADPYKNMKLGDRAYILEVDQSHHIPQSTLDVIGGLLKTQDSQPITTATEAIDKFVHLI